MLPAARQEGCAHPIGMLTRISIHVGDAFSLEFEDGENPRLVPVLYRVGGDLDERLLPDDLHHEFAHRQFNGFNDARNVYTLVGGSMLVLSPPLRRALSVVGRLQSASPTTRRDLFVNPRAYLRDALGDEEETRVEHVFRETPAYSERVIGLGLWKKRVVPWVQVAATDWFAGVDAVYRPGRPPEGGLRIGDTRV
jgi:hypothetical protein